MRILVDYRPALRTRSGVGEWVHQLSRAILAAVHTDQPAARDVELTLFTASWSDRPDPDAIRELEGAAVVDRRVPTRPLTWIWSRFDWPPIERLARQPIDLVLSPTPLSVPTRHAANAITIHDLDFLDHPGRASGEMKHVDHRLTGRHAARADLVVAVSAYTAGVVRDRLHLPPERIVVCRAGVPGWLAGGSAPRRGPSGGEYILFVGTLEPRKNVPALLDAYGLLLARGPGPPLVLAGRLAESPRAWEPRLRSLPPWGRVDLRGYVAEREKPALYRGAAMLVLPSFEEGFGLPALEAMAMGVPVVASRVGAIPEVVGDAALLVPPGDARALSDAMSRVLSEPGLASELHARGLRRSRDFDWMTSACSLLESFRTVVARRSGKLAGGGRP
ncbi:MAG: glycosyltransferase family 1 protein [Acidobacteriota bacterium]